MKKNKVLKRILQLLIIICFILSAFFLYKYFNDINTQYKNAEVSIKEAKTTIADKTDYRKTKPSIGTPIGTIQIEGLTDEMPIIEGDDLDKAMSKGVGHIESSPLPGTYSKSQPVAFSAHRETFFKSLKDVKNGDIVIVRMPYGTYKYKITSHIIVKPDEGSKVYTTEGMKGKERVVLITCYPFSPWSNPSKRIAFFGDLIQ
ncbi:MAG: class D sortase [Bacilli bacterium]|jgi:sortase A|nr:class D sortase [Bacilli bacterium]